jgi:hypothetical protein
MFLQREIRWINDYTVFQLTFISQAKTWTSDIAMLLCVCVLQPLLRTETVQSLHLVAFAIEPKFTTSLKFSAIVLCKTMAQFKMQTI